MKRLVLFLFIIFIVMAGCVSTKNKETEPVKDQEPVEEVGEVVYSFGFETGDPGDWVPKGPVILAVASDNVHSGDYSLLSSGRSATWNAPEIFLTDLVKDNWQYMVSVWVYIPEDSPAGDVKLTVQTNSGGNNNWIQIANPKNVNPGEWMEIKGKYKHAGSFDAVSLYVEALDPTVDFYIDDIEITGAEM